MLNDKNEKITLKGITAIGSYYNQEPKTTVTSDLKSPARAARKPSKDHLVMHGGKTGAQSIPNTVV